MLVQRGTLHGGDIVVAGAEWGRVRALVSDTGAAINGRLLARSATQDLDSLTGLLSWDGFKTRVESWTRSSEPPDFGSL